MLTVTKPFDILIFSVSSLLCLGLAYWVTTRHRTRGTDMFGLLLALVSFWSLNSVAKLTVLSRPAQAVIIRADFVLMLLVPVVWFVFAAQYTGRDIYRSRPFLVGAGCLLASGLVLAVVNPGSLLFRSVQAVAEPFFHFHPKIGVLYWPYLLVGYGLLLAGIGFLLRVLLLTDRNVLPTGMLVAGSLFPLAFNLEYVLGVGVFHGIDYTSLGVGLFAVVCTGAVSQNLFDSAPVSQDVIMRNIRDGMIIIGTDRRVIKYNDEAAELAEMPPAELSGAPIADAFPAIAASVELGDDDIAAIQGPTRPDAFDAEPAGAVVQTTDADGRSRYCSVTTSPITRGSFHLGWSLMLTDITETKETQQELRRQNRQLDEFASTVSHDLRNPLTVLGGTAEILEDSLRAVDEGERSWDTVDAGELLGHVERIQRTSLRMETIIDDLLTLANQGKTVTETEEIDVAELVDEACECVETHEARIRVERNGAILGNRTRVQSIFENLIRNAVEHAGHRATVTVCVDDDGFYVQDDGPGIPPDETDRVFDYGYTSRQRGTGLGLAIVKTMSEAHGWSVAVDTDYTAGSRIRFSGVDVVTVDALAESRV